MSQQGASGFDLSKLGTAQKIVGGGAAAFIVWTFLPVWYSCCEYGGLSTGDLLGGGTVGMSGFRFPVMLAFLCALAALAGVVMTALGTSMNLPMKAGTLQLAVAGAGLVLTILGLVIKPGSFGVSASASWGLFVGIVIAGVWTYGAFMWHKEPEAATGSDAAGTPQQ